MKTEAQVREMWLKFVEADDARKLGISGESVMEVLDWVLGYSASDGDVEAYLPPLGSY